MKIKLLKLLDRAVGIPLSHIMPKIKKAGGVMPAEFRRILVIRPGGLGDAVLLLPALEALKAHLPGLRIDVLGEKRNNIFGISSSVSRVYLYDRGHEMLECLKGGKYDAVIDTEQWHRLPAVLAYLTGAPVRIGFDTNPERARLFTHKIPYSHDDYEVLSFLNLLKPLINKVPAFNPDEPFIIKVSDDSTLSKDRAVAVFPGATVRERRWGGERFGLAGRALRDMGYKILILGSEKDRKEAEIIRRYVSDSMDFTGRTSLKEAARLLKSCRLLITADSGLMHIAYAVGTPTVSLFGSGRQKKWAPKGRRHIILNKNLLCSPCTTFGYTPRCKINVQCLSLISVDEVIEAAIEALKSI